MGLLGPQGSSDFIAAAVGWGKVHLREDVSFRSMREHLREDVSFRSMRNLREDVSFRSMREHLWEDVSIRSISMEGHHV